VTEENGPNRITIKLVIFRPNRPTGVKGKQKHICKSNFHTSSEMVNKKIFIFRYQHPNPGLITCHHSNWLPAKCDFLREKIEILDIFSFTLIIFSFWIFIM